jgi:hypothetical protein
LKTALGMASAKGELSLVVAKGGPGCWRHNLSRTSNIRRCDYSYDIYDTLYSEVWEQINQLIKILGFFLIEILKVV